MRVEIYTDGACSGNGKPNAPGGWAYYMRALRSNNGRKDLLAEKHDSGNKLGTTNNEMELMAILEALKQMKPQWAGRCSVHIYSDSKYCIRIFQEYLENGEKKPAWIHAWRRYRWKTSSGTPVLNRKLIEEIDELVSLFRTEESALQFHWVRGHSGHLINTRVDELAVAAKMELMQRA